MKRITLASLQTNCNPWLGYIVDEQNQNFSNLGGCFPSFNGAVEFQSVKRVQNSCVEVGLWQGAALGEMAIPRVEMIGLTLPRCHGKCSSCGPCKVIQVPMNYQENQLSKVGQISTSPLAVGEFSSPSQGIGGSSTHEPISWKRKCRKFIFNP